MDLNSEKFELDHQFIGRELIGFVCAGRGEMEGVDSFVALDWQGLPPG